MTSRTEISQAIHTLAQLLKETQDIVDNQPVLYARLMERAKKNRRAVKDELEIRLEESLSVSDELDDEERQADGKEE